MTRIFLSVLATLILALASQPANALPLTSKNWKQPLHTFSMEQTFPAQGIVKMSNCSASLVKFKGVSENSPAIVLTNGHCTGGKTPFDMFLRPNEIHDHLARTFRMGLLNTDGTQIVSLLATEVIYATMTFSDFGLLKLDKTYAQLHELAPAVEPLVISDVHPKAGTEIRIPSGYWKKTYSCSIDAFVPTLKEAGYIWNDSIRYKQPGCETIGGTSGSPILSAASNEIIGINNTGNEDGQSCTLNNPCEQNADGSVVVTKGASYGQETYILYSCLDSRGSFDVSLPSCNLPKGN